MMVIDSCPGCGYPKFGPDLCAFCRPVPALGEVARLAPTEGFTGDVAAAPAV